MTTPALSSLQDILSASGDNNTRLLRSGMDLNVLRPWLDAKGRPCITVNDGYDKDGKPKYRSVLAANAGATLSRDQWIQFDEALVRAARPAMRVWNDLQRAGLTYNIPNGMGVTMIQHQSMTDAGEATLSMDGLRETNRDRPTYDLAQIPVPIVHSDFFYSLREIEVSRRQRLPLDTTMIEQNTRKCMELVEKLTIGSLGSYSYGGGTVYGLTNFPNRVTKTLTAPTAAGWTPAVTYSEVLEMIQAMQDVFFNGPYLVWYSPAWTQYFDADYSAAYPGGTLRDKLGRLPDIRSWNKADYLTGFQIVMAQATPDVIQAVTGQRLRLIQWEAAGGMELRFKLIGIMFPRIRANSDGDTGIIHGSA